MKTTEVTRIRLAAGERAALSIRSAGGLRMTMKCSGPGNVVILKYAVGEGRSHSPLVKLKHNRK